MQVMLKRKRGQQLPGNIELDNASCELKNEAVSGAMEVKTGRRSRSPWKQPNMANLVRIKMYPVKGFQKPEIRCWSEQQLSLGSHIVTDGLPAALNGLDEAGFEHVVIVTGGSTRCVEQLVFRWVNKILGNIKNVLHCAYRAIRSNQLPRYQAEFEYRFNRRNQLVKFLLSLVYASNKTPQILRHLLKSAEAIILIMLRLYSKNSTKVNCYV